MKAVRLHDRGGPEQLFYEDAPDPEPEPGYALVEIRATGITPRELDWPETWARDGQPRTLPIAGHELSGVVRDAPPGADVRPGDEVFALTEWDRDGTLAELTTVRVGDLARKPASIDHVHTAALPLSALTAWQAFRRHAHVEPGQVVLVHGASGGVGSYAVQLAHYFGATVIGTASARNKDFVTELGCDEVVDYATTDFRDVVKDVDVVLDPIGGDTLQRSYDVLRPGGYLVSILDPVSAETLAAHGIEGSYFIVEPDRAGLTEIAALVDSGDLRSIVSTVLPLSEARAAYTQGRGGHNRGKIVLTVG